MAAESLQYSKLQSNMSVKKLYNSDVPFLLTVTTLCHYFETKQRTYRKEYNIAFSKCKRCQVWTIKITAANLVVDEELDSLNGNRRWQQNWAGFTLCIYIASVDIDWRGVHR